MSVESITAEFVDLGRKGSRKILLGLSGSEEKGQSSKGGWPFLFFCGEVEWFDRGDSLLA